LIYILKNSSIYIVAQEAQLTANTMSHVNTLTFT